MSSLPGNVFNTSSHNKYVIPTLWKTCIQVVRIRGPQDAPQLEVSVWITKALASCIDHIQALIDSGATISAIDDDFTRKCRLVRFRLPEPLMSTNADGTHNAAGLIMHR